MMLNCQTTLVSRSKENSLSVLRFALHVVVAAIRRSVHGMTGLDMKGKVFQRAVHWMVSITARSLCNINLAAPSQSVIVGEVGSLE